MRNNKFFLAVIVGAVVFFLLGFLIYGVLLKDALHAQMMAGIERDEPIIWMLFLGNIVWAYFITTVFSSWSDVTTPSAGAMRGAMIAFFVSLSSNIVWYAHSHLMSKWGVMTDVVAWTVINAIGGAVIAWTLKMGYKTQTAS